ncbi:unnamed protein product [Danaus chrysippus]|uniref:(African queen) hypothetical protein n=1 Tax=Danaus chrysippus TaxID=151541 RepID=A0A8J2R6K2_9NEOP|nr:unnamed protein product [Danaus chrysippus]
MVLKINDVGEMKLPPPPHHENLPPNEGINFEEKSAKSSGAYAQSCTVLSASGASNDTPRKFTRPHLLGPAVLRAADLVRRRGVRRRLAGGEASLVKHRSAHSTDARLGDYALRNTPRHKQHDMDRSGSPPDVATTY